MCEGHAQPHGNDTTPQNRPEEQWVPSGAQALEHNKYTGSMWPSTQRFEFYIAKCKEVLPPTPVSTLLILSHHRA